MVETEGPCARAHALAAFLQGGSKSFEIYTTGMMVIIRNRIRVFLLARNETGHLHIPRLRLTRLKSRPMIRRCAGGHRKSRWIAVAIHKRDICGKVARRGAICGLIPVGAIVLRRGTSCAAGLRRHQRAEGQDRHGCCDGHDALRHEFLHLASADQSARF
jgi:hypothetical protein